MQCRIEGCCRQADYKKAQLCSMHHERKRRHGTTDLPQRYGGLMGDVEAALCELGPSTVLALCAVFPLHTRKQVQTAMENLTALNRAHCVLRERGVRGWAPGVYAAGPRGSATLLKPVAAALPPRGSYRIPRVSSVFDLGAVDRACL